MWEWRNSRQVKYKSVQITQFYILSFIQFWQKFRESNGFTKVNYKTTKDLIWLTEHFFGESEFLVFPRTQHVTLWKFRNFIATVFSQKFRQINVLLKNITIHWFDGKKFAWQKISRFSTLCYCTVWKNEKLTLIEKIFRQTNYLVISLVKP